MWGCVAVIYVGKAEKSIARQEASPGLPSRERILGRRKAGFIR